MLSNKLEQFISRAIKHILTGEIQVIFPAREKDRINIAMYRMFTCYIQLLYNPFVHFKLFCISFSVLILYGILYLL